MKKEQRKVAQRVLARANELGLKSANGSALEIGQIEELLAAQAGYRNRHAHQAALRSCEAPALVQENPQEANNDYKLVSGKGVWIQMGAFSVHPYLTDEGVVVDVYAGGAEMDSITSTYAFDSDAEEQVLEYFGLELEEVEEWAAEHKKSLETIDTAAWLAWIRECAESRNPAEAPATLPATKDLEEQLNAAGYQVLPRDPKVNPAFTGAWMVVDVEDEDGFEIVGDDRDALIREAHQHLMTD